MKLIFRSLALLTLFMGLMTGCTDLDNPEVGGMNEPNHPDAENVAYGLLGPGPANYGAIHERRQPHHIDQEVNNTGLSYRDPVSARHSIGDDQDDMERVVWNIDGVVPGTILITGGNATVHVQLENQGLKQEEKDKKIRHVYRKLRQANPRYNYQVVINDFR
ncbi:hypothetical protein [Alteribacter natronophilus]|uniref:hypothetical protein n=1 Tax=Alteribacter natronophilus TaxID=2583810 RepID=UPI00110DD958|nr:hypothetical protein [Alteribacter natronophilus]TMW72151.1 hypothetical protein FGB90_08010 [Alteribacter natronophilus]